MQNDECSSLEYLLGQEQEQHQCYACEFEMIVEARVMVTKLMLIPTKV